MLLDDGRIKLRVEKIEGTRINTFVECGGELSNHKGIGCPILLGVSRKRFIGEIGKAQNTADRLGGSIAVGLEGLRQGVQMLRVHDVRETVQAVRLFEAMA